MPISRSTNLTTFPPNLAPGQKVCVVAPSGALYEQEKFQQGAQIWRDRGYQVEIPATLVKSHGYLAGDDQYRRQQLRSAWNDPECVAIVCARGGYGATRLLEDWHWQNLQPEPKWLIGFSDITALLWAWQANLGIGGLHAPLLTTIAAEPHWSQALMFDWLEGKRDQHKLIGQGWGNVAEGILLPGNLTVATNLLNTSLCPDLDQVILAFEDTGEAPYRVDRMLTYWRMTGALAKVVGIALGQFDHVPLSANRPNWQMEQVWRDRLADLNIPVVTNLQFGHGSPNMALPVGCQARIDGAAGELSFWR
ncbi:peptidase U61 LD-carboxypeptidase A [Thalassoporum mexicanum PCC 7367]|uniref:S66 peptidase family protein n=1 Tax=Thalassoporum mexicanum TaxID=3457544 RepID=UPI00029F8700|nr:LD-carboxypeptidase [Pseudanabaena sp. PCC 7367]AFY69601.1 peptidase U61 LD-carboxypeptidase A [Pseudanabaena sp. PCC 7367]